MTVYLWSKKRWWFWFFAFSFYKCASFTTLVYVSSYLIIDFANTKYFVVAAIIIVTVFALFFERGGPPFVKN